MGSDFRNKFGQEMEINNLRNQVIHSLELLDAIVEINKEMFRAGLITPTGGNISARLSSKPNEIWITPSQVYKGDLNTSMMVPIDIDGNLLNGYDFRPSSERFVHCEILRRRTDINAVIHTHAPEAALMDLLDEAFMPISRDAALIGEIPRTPFIMPGTRELGIQVATAFGNGFAVIMKNHGLIVGGKDLRQAADITFVIEETAKKILRSRAMGKEPRILSSDALANLAKRNELVG